MLEYGAFSYLLEDVVKTNRYFQQDIGKSGTLFFSDGKKVRHF
jgi:hypothetical protein